MRTQQFIGTALILSSLSFIGVHQTVAATPASKELKTTYLVDDNMFVETDLTIEEWMVNDAFWATTTEKMNRKTNTMNDEENLNIEEWMSNDNYWEKAKGTSLKTDNETVEEPLEISDWMVSDNYWK
jgi:hypothetical protein